LKELRKISIGESGEGETRSFAIIGEALLPEEPRVIIGTAFDERAAEMQAVFCEGRTMRTGVRMDYQYA
jgi:hypothetical protein